VIDTETGETQNYVKEDPYPWLAAERRGEVSLSYGYKFRSATSQTEPVARLQFGYDAVRIKAITVGVRATVDSDRDAFVGLSVSIKF
jgi:hypothetical protein